MKLEDIKKTLVHSAEVQLKRAIYDACGIIDDAEKISEIVLSTLDEVYKDVSSEVGEVEDYSE